MIPSPLGHIHQKAKINSRRNTIVHEDLKVMPYQKCMSLIPRKPKLKCYSRNDSLISEKISYTNAAISRTNSKDISSKDSDPILRKRGASIFDEIKIYENEELENSKKRSKFHKFAVRKYSIFIINPDSILCKVRSLHIFAYGCWISSPAV